MKMNNRYIFRGKRKDNGSGVEGYLYITHNNEYEIGKYDAEIADVIRTVCGGRYK